MADIFEVPQPAKDLLEKALKTLTKIITEELPKHSS